MGRRMRTIRTETDDIYWGGVSAEGGEVFDSRGSWYGWINRVAKCGLNKGWRGNVWIDHPKLQEYYFEKCPERE